MLIGTTAARHRQCLPPLHLAVDRCPYLPDVMAAISTLDVMTVPPSRIIINVFPRGCRLLVLYRVRTTFLLVTVPCCTHRPTLVQMLLLVQTNVSARVDHEVRMTLMNETQMGMLEQVG